MSRTASAQVRWAPYLFLAPFLVVFCLFTAYPIIRSLVLSTQQTYGPQTSMFVGMRNFSLLMRDPMFWVAMKNTIVYALGSLLVQLPLALALAIALNHPRLKGRAIFRLIFFSPALVGIAFVAVLFGPFIEKNTGLVNIAIVSVLQTLGLQDVVPFTVEFAWLESYVMPALILASLWMYVGFNMVYFLAALQNVDASLLEASRVDGAGAWSRFLNVTIPAIRPVGLFIVLMSMIGSFQLFELPYILLNFGPGPDNRGLTVVMYLYENGFVTRDLGYASAIGWCLTLVLLVIAAVVRGLMKRFEDD